MSYNYGKRINAKNEKKLGDIFAKNNVRTASFCSFTDWL